MKVGLYLAALAMLGLCLAGRGALAQAQTQPQNPGQDWPCDQVLQPQLSVGSMWEGPDPTEACKVWQNDEQVRALVARVAPRRVPIPDAKAEIHRFAIAISADKQKIMTEVFAGLFETVNHDRSSIIRGIRRYHGRQEALAKDIEDKTAALDNLDPASTDQAVAQKRVDMENALNWETRIFDDRSRLLPAVCDQPVLLEQRLYQLSHAVMDEMGS